MWDNSNNDNGLQNKTRIVQVKEYASDIRSMSRAKKRYSIESIGKQKTISPTA
jgi:hypothetical protein